MAVNLTESTARAFADANAVLAAGAIGQETDTGKLKIGDGATAWNALAYFEDDDKLTQLVGVSAATAAVSAAGGGGGGGSDLDLIGKVTDETPWGGPGLFANSSTDPVDGGWLDFQIDASDSWLTVGWGESSSYMLFFREEFGEDERDSGFDSFIVSDDQSLSAAAEVNTQIHSGAASAYINLAPQDGHALGRIEGLQLQWGSEFGSRFRMKGGDGQTDPLIDVKANDGTELFAINPDGSGVLGALGQLVAEGAGTGDPALIPLGGANDGSSEFGVAIVPGLIDLFAVVDPDVNSYLEMSIDGNQSTHPRASVDIFVSQPDGPSVDTSFQSRIDTVDDALVALGSMGVSVVDGNGFFHISGEETDAGAALVYSSADGAYGIVRGADGQTLPLLDLRANDDSHVFTVSPSGDQAFGSNAVGSIYVDRSDGHTYRLKVTAGVLGTELVS